MIQLIQSTLPEDITFATSLYESAFPDVERRPTLLWQSLIHTSPYISLFLITDVDGERCGFLTSWSFDGFVYVEHFAIAPERRSSGIGSEALFHFCQMHEGQNIVLEVELPDNEIARRRIAFYSRHGFTPDAHHYIQPPYAEGYEWFPLQLMSTHPERTAASFDYVRRTIYQHVYGCNESL